MRRSAGARAPGEGRYALIAPLATGGMATVWRCRDRRLGVDRAIKLLNGDLARDCPGAVSRFEREARLLARLEHPHVVPIHDAGVDDEGPWIVMSLLPRGSIADRVERDGPLDWPEAARVGRQVLEALIAAHAAGVVHRDLKPHDVLVDDRGVARLSDFGVARGPGDDGVPRTGTEEVLGTWRFMAPEQRASGRRADARTDVHGLGVLLVALATPRDPLDLAHPESRAVLLAEVPAPIRAFVDRCTRPDPAERYPTARAAVRALEEVRWDRPRRRTPVPLVWVALLLAGFGSLATMSAALGVGVARLASTETHPVQTEYRPAEPSRPAPLPTAAALRAPPRTPLAPEAGTRGGARVRVAVAGGVFQVAVDGRARGPSPWSGRIPPGRHRLVLSDSAGRVVHRRAWDSGREPSLCLEPPAWSPCRR